MRILVHGFCVINYIRLARDVILCKFCNRTRFVAWTRDCVASRLRVVIRLCALPAVVIGFWAGTEMLRMTSMRIVITVTTRL